MSTYHSFSSYSCGFIRRFLHPIAAGGCGLALLGAQARAIDFAFVYLDAAGTGFFDPTDGEQRREAFEYAANIWGRLILPSYAGEVIRVQAQFDDFAPDVNTLAAASANLFYADFGSSNPSYVENVAFGQPLANHLKGADLAPDENEIRVSVNRASDFYYGTDSAPGTKTDFVSVILHEIGHGLGFDASFQESGALDGGLAKSYDRFLTLGPGGPALLGLALDARGLAMTSDFVFWNGAGGIAGNGGAPPQIFAPATWAPGSSISHVSDPASSMFPSFAPSTARQVPSGIDRGILRDLGWNISVASTALTWTGGVSDHAGTQGNWGPTALSVPMPGDRLVFGTGAAQTAVRIDFRQYTLSGITFGAGAPDYTLRFSPGGDLDITDAGVVNDSTSAHTINLETGFDAAGPSRGRLTFKGIATAGNVNYQLAGGNTTVVANPPVGYIFVRTLGGELGFSQSSTAGDASFELEGGSGDGGLSSVLKFTENASAATADIWNRGGRVGPTLPVSGFPAFQAGFGGQTRFEDKTKAGTALIRNEGVNVSTLGTGGYTLFTDQASAEQAMIENSGGFGFQRGGFTEFTGTATADRATFRNLPGIGAGTGVGGRTVFFADSTAGSGKFFNGSPTTAPDSDAETIFRDRSTAAAGEFTNYRRGLTRFFDDSTAGDATIRLTFAPGVTAGGQAEFNDRSTAANASIVIRGVSASSSHSGNLRFNGNSSAGEAFIFADEGVGGFEIAFRGQSTASESFITLTDNARALLFFEGSSTAGDARISIGAFSTMRFRDTTNAGTSEIDIQAQAGTTVVGGGHLGDSQVTIHGANTPWVSGPDGGGNVLIEQGGSAADASIFLNGGTVAGARGGRLTFSVGGLGGTAFISVAGGAVEGASGGIVSFAGTGSAPDASASVQPGGKVVIESWFLPRETAVGAISGAGTFELRPGTHLVTGSKNADSTVSGQITGIGHLTKVGTGALTLDGTNSYFGLTTVDAGALVINGSISGDATVNNGGVLKGTGSIGGKVTVNAGGIFAPGASPGTMTVASLDLLADGVIEFELGLSRDLIVSTGNISLAGNLRILLSDNYVPVVGEVIPLFQTPGQVTGDFAAIEIPGLPSDFQFSPSFSDGTYCLTVTSGPAGFSGWITDTFTGGTTVPAGKQGPNDDPDNDGIGNLLEYAIAGEDPTVPNAAMGTLIGGTFGFTKRAGTSGLTYAIQDSTDLGLTDAWAEVPAGPSYTNDANTIAYTLTPGSPATIFIRLSVTVGP